MKRSCFTLVELLVVIATVTFLIAISLPSLQSSKHQAKAVLCNSNVKQLTFGLLLYETENQTLPYGFDNTPNEPPQGVYPGFIEYDRAGWWWFNFVDEFCNNLNSKKTVLLCPSTNIGSQMLKNNILCGNYGVNRSLCKSFDDRQSYREEFVGRPLSVSDIPRPSQTLLIVDSGYAIISWWHATDEPPVALSSTIIEDTAYIPGLEINKKRDLWPGQEQDAIYGRHPNKTVNVGFIDGHFNRVKAEELFVEKTATDYRNKSPLWSPK